MSKLLVFVGQIALTAEQAAIVMPVLMTPGVVVQSQYLAGKPYYVADESPATVFHLSDCNFLSEAEWGSLNSVVVPATMTHDQENS